MLQQVIVIPDGVMNDYIVPFLEGFEEGLFEEYELPRGVRPPGWRRPIRDRKRTSLTYAEAIREVSESMSLAIPGEEEEASDSENEDEGEEVREEVGEVEALSSDSDVEDEDEAVRDAEVEESVVREEEEDFLSSSSSDDDGSDSDYEP